MERSLAQQFEAALLDMDRVAARRILADVSHTGSPASVVESVVVPALEAIGEAWTGGSVSLAQVYMAGRICEDEIAATLTGETPGSTAGPRCAVVVLEDYHLLGKRIVLSALRSTGVHVLDYGRMTVAEVLEKLAVDGVSILFVSVLMLPAALRVRDLVSSIRRLQLPVRVVVGGAPFRLDDTLWREVGADAMGRTASDAIRIVHELQGGAA